MGDEEPYELNRLLRDLNAGDREAFGRLLTLVYGELHQIAGRQRQRWDGDETLDTTGLVHEVYLKLADQSAPDWQSYPHFLAVASTAMRQILIDYAKRKRSAKRGGAYHHVPLDEVDAAINSSVTADARSANLLALDQSLRKLEKLNERQGKIVECRFFGGMSIQDTATALGIAPATVSRSWVVAKAWLYRDLKANLENTA